MNSNESYEVMGAILTGWDVERNLEASFMPTDAGLVQPNRSYPTEMKQITETAAAS